MSPAPILKYSVDILDNNIFIIKTSEIGAG
jgi:hypothetical protein